MHTACTSFSMASIDIEQLEQARREHEHIQYLLEQEQKLPSILDAEREKHRQRWVCAFDCA